MQFDTTEVKNKRFRASNFTEHEKNTLYSLVFKYKNVIENKKTDGTNIYEKRQTWEKITKEFNSASPGLISRSSESLRKCYDNRKKELRKEMAKERCELYKTGGGPPPPPKKPEDDLILSIVHEKTIFGLENPYDGDSLNLESNNSEISQSTPNNPVKMSDNLRITKRPLEIKKNIFNLEKGELLTNNDDDMLEFELDNVDPNDFIENENRKENLNDNRKQNQMPRGRRRPATVVKALSSSNIADKYDKLLDQRLLLCNYEMIKVKTTVQNNDMEHKLKVESLRLDCKT